MGWFFFQWDHSRGPSDHEARPDLAEREQHCDRMAALLPPIIIQKPSFFLFIYISSYHSGEGKESLFMKSDWVIWCSWCPAAPPNQSEGEGRSPRSSFWCRLRWIISACNIGGDTGGSSWPGSVWWIESACRPGVSLFILLLEFRAKWTWFPFFVSEFYLL